MKEIATFDQQVKRKVTRNLGAGRRGDGDVVISFLRGTANLKLALGSRTSGGASISDTNVGFELVKPDGSIRLDDRGKTRHGDSQGHRTNLRELELQDEVLERGVHVGLKDACGARLNHLSLVIHKNGHLSRDSEQD